MSNLFFAQTKKDSIWEFYREDQFYLGVSLIASVRGDDDLVQKGLSSHFQLGFVRDVPLVASGQVALGVGLGFSRQLLNANLIRWVDNKNNVFYAYDTKDRMSFSFNSIEFPVSFRWRTSTATKYKFWRIYGGMKFRRQLCSRAVTRDNKVKIDREIRPWLIEGFLSFGFSTLNLYFSYEFQSAFKGTTQQGKPIDVKGMKIGLIFYFL